MASSVSNHGAANRATPLAPVLTVVWLCSLGTAVVWQGVFFVAKEQYAFGPLLNYSLAIAGAVMYVAGALTSGRAVRLAGNRKRGLDPRAFLLGLMVFLATVCVLAGLGDAPWTLWVFMLVYAPLTGWMWPLLESFVASGRSGRRLARATGRFNIAWASAIPVQLLVMGPMLEAMPLVVLTALGAVHLACLPLLLMLPLHPEAHGAAQVEDEVPKELARRLLHVFRGLLAFSYVLISYVLPGLPDRLAEFGVGVDWRTPLVSTWVLVRVGMFVLLERWHGWHGRWRTPAWSLGALLVGFALLVSAGDPVTLVAGLVVFGIGAGGAYNGAIFYAMDVGAAEVDAGGKHEAVLGAGYLAGPVIGLGVTLIR